MRKLVTIGLAAIAAIGVMAPRAAWANGVRFSSGHGGLRITVGSHRYSRQGPVRRIYTPYGGYRYRSPQRVFVQPSYPYGGYPGGIYPGGVYRQLPTQVITPSRVIIVKPSSGDHWNGDNDSWKRDDSKNRDNRGYDRMYDWRY